MNQDQNIDLRDYENPSEEVLNDNTVADTTNLLEDVEKLDKRVRELGRNVDAEKLKLEFPNLDKEFPTIFDKVVNRTMDMGRLKFMVKMIGEIEKKKISKHEASVVVGKELVENIVKPQMDKNK
tara:strand:+ start:115 stop:486 length:372 start_codon:yes stop_codon:yes gene_type:complete